MQIRRFVFSHLKSEGTFNYQLVVTVVIKNCEPFVSGPAFAIDRSPIHKKEKKKKCYYLHKFGGFFFLGGVGGCYLYLVRYALA